MFIPNPSPKPPRGPSFSPLPPLPPIEGAPDASGDGAAAASAALIASACAWVIVPLVTSDESTVETCGGTPGK